MKYTLLISAVLLLMCIPLQQAYAQIDLDCNGRDLHSIYGLDNLNFYRIDSVDTNPTNPIAVTPNPMGIGGISINTDLNTMSGQDFMYYINSSMNYLYWDGTNWVNTFHTSGSFSALNIGGTSDYLFNLDGTANSLYRYDGTSNGTLLMSNLNTNSNSIYDVATDNQGNFYLFYTTNQQIISYTPAGIPIDTFTTTGFPTGINPGFAILGNRMYAFAGPGSGLYEGIKTGNTISFTLIMNVPVIFTDIAACPQAGNPLAVFKNPGAPHFAIYPNPVRDVAVMRLDNAATIEITDCMGILKKSIRTKGLTEYRLEVSDWKPGAYFIRALSENKIAAHTVMVIQ